MIINLYKLNLENRTEKEIHNIFCEKQYRKLEEKDYNGIEYGVYLKEEKRNKQKWLQDLEKEFKFSTEINIGNIVNGIMLIKFIKKPNKIYAITFGHAFNVVQSVCDTNFALDFAEKEISEGNIVLKNSHFIENMVLKEIRNYKNNVTVIPETGEIYKFVSGKPMHDNIFGKIVECGYSIKFSYLSEINFKNLEKLIKEVERIIQKKDIISTFPRIRTYNKKDEITEILDEYLLEKLKNDNEMKEKLDLNISKFVLGGADFYFEHSYENKKIFINRKRNSSQQEVETLNVADIVDYIKNNKNEIKKLSDIKIELISESNEKAIIKEIKEYFFVEIEYEKKRYVLNDGNWGLYNEKFFEVLNSNLDEINEKCVKFKEEYNISFKTEDELIEKIVNSQKDKYIKLHKALIKAINGSSRIELADIYDKNNAELIAIKQGSNTANLSYCFEQGILAQSILKVTAREEIKNQLKDRVEENIIDEIIDCKNNSILLYIENHKNIIEENGKMDLKEFRSLLLKLKIVVWYKMMTMYLVKPILYIQIKK